MPQLSKHILSNNQKRVTMYKDKVNYFQWLANSDESIFIVIPLCIVSILIAGNKKN